MTSPYIDEKPATSPTSSASSSSSSSSARPRAVLPVTLRREHSSPDLNKDLTAEDGDEKEVSGKRTRYQRPVVKSATTRAFNWTVLLANYCCLVLLLGSVFHIPAFISKGSSPSSPSDDNLHGTVGTPADTQEPSESMSSWTKFLPLGGLYSWSGADTHSILTLAKPKVDSAGVLTMPKRPVEASAPERSWLGTGRPERKVKEVMGLSRVDCDACRVGDSLCETLGEYNIARSMVHPGTSSRVHRLLAKLRSGEAITLSVIGGSPSAGLGIGSPSNGGGQDGKHNMHRLVFDHIVSTFPIPASLPQHRFVNKAEEQERETSETMAELASLADEESDLVLLDLATFGDKEEFDLEGYERLLRKTLSLRNQPAVIAMHVFDLATTPSASPADSQLGLSAWYDIPTVSLRNMLLPQLWRSSSSTEAPFWFAPGAHAASSSPDLAHLGRPGHEVMAGLVNIFLDRQACRVEAGMEASGRAGKGKYQHHGEEWTFSHSGAAAESLESPSMPKPAHGNILESI